MTRYILDTTALIDFSKAHEPAHARIQQMIDAGDELAVCAINVAEFYAGLPPAQRAIWDRFLGALVYWDISREDARQAGVWRYEFARKGIVLSTTDTLVAAVAQGQSAIIVTNNVKDYPMPGVRLLPLKP